MHCTVVWCQTVDRHFGRVCHQAAQRATRIHLHWMVCLNTLGPLPAGRAEQPSAAIFDSRTLPSTPESGTRAGEDGAKRTRGSIVHMAVDTLGHLLALHVTPANEQDRSELRPLAAKV